ncbi:MULTISPECIES: type II toxin-antitoxin system HipA family toxin [unclassified Dorea]|uniref:type II toxin-antitoxin system HipA family toxin n=1 Tax=unclassified Dorea TaxID=2627917 RepID=UPI000E4795F7|nr:MULTISPECIES: type II toxin-antitoxin system HipA family toxin [unclassified Dorea]RGY82810.1 type II toxin-antitoxin system HipA family toxin [Dorea sp. AM58-8]RHP10075.1 type II toxin-antitoxin system HipA family toxin [Dorea sp. AF36-15AT]
MQRLAVQIEVKGAFKQVGEIVGTSSDDARFTYTESYLKDPESRAVSISMPLEQQSFSVESTRNFFEGLLPEGFTRRCVAEWLHRDEKDYLAILAGLGQECLGAIKIIDESRAVLPSKYKELTSEEVKKLAQEGATESAEMVTKSHLSLTGASGKVGLYYDEQKDKWYLPIGEAPSTHIVKQSHIRLKRIVANEQLCLLTAKNLGIEIPQSFIIKTESNEAEDVLFATKRYDRRMQSNGRKLNGMNIPYRLHQEDFSQALGIPASEKYEKDGGSYLSKMFGILRDYSASPIEDQLKLWDICVFNFLIGNTDNHIKNLSLLYGKDLKTIRLAPAYDIVSTMVYESSTENMALSIGGDYSIRKITEESFAKEATKAGLGVKMAMKRLDTLRKNFVEALNTGAQVLEEQGFEGTKDIAEQIMSCGGIRNYI